MWGLGLELPGLGLVSKSEPGLGLGGYGLDYITNDDIKNKFRKMHKFWNLHLGIFDDVLVAKFWSGLRLEGHGLDYITAKIAIGPAFPKSVPV